MDKTDVSLFPCLTPTELITAELVLVFALSLHQAPAPCHVSPIAYRLLLLDTTQHMGMDRQPRGHSNIQTAVSYRIVFS